ncbi:hypothetical protein CEXT_235781 [Caerostris extrusa]|uniref:Uncharacterized protein n=1 Tax=Caerostris extrusa TaxID=172846 RepID=A0AAV4N620_CAEEX|nr:hypothetical protein CEXT_235781 [Caerostris extrusa]
MYLIIFSAIRYFFLPRQLLSLSDWMKCTSIPRSMPPGDVTKEVGVTLVTLNICPLPPHTLIGGGNQRRIFRIAMTTVKPLQTSPRRI